MCVNPKINTFDFKFLKRPIYRANKADGVHQVRKQVYSGWALEFEHVTINGTAFFVVVGEEGESRVCSRGRREGNDIKEGKCRSVPLNEGTDTICFHLSRISVREMKWRWWMIDSPVTFCLKTRNLAGGFSF